MGALLSFCSDPEESEKPKLLGDAPQSASEHSNSALQEQEQPSSHEAPSELQQATTASSLDSNKNAQAERALREEQARLELIVSDAGRSMVAVRSTRANHDYYDQGFAAALAQHLQEQIGSSSALPTTLPSPSKDINVFATLNSNPWDHVQLGTQTTGLAGCAGENPNTYMNHVAESFLASVVPTREHLFNQVEPMVENLL